MTINGQPVHVKLIASAVGLLFLVAGLSKILDPISFMEFLSRSHGLPLSVKAFLVSFVPGMEIALGISLSVGFAPRESTFLAALLFGIFLVVSIHNVYTGHLSQCSCFKFNSDHWKWLSMGGWWAVTRNLLLCTATFLAFSSSDPPVISMPGKS